MKKHQSLRHALALLTLGSLSLMSAGCELFLIISAANDGDPPPDCFECWDTNPDPDPPLSSSQPPSVSIDIADWPPMGPDSSMRVTAVSDVPLWSAEALFRNATIRTFPGNTDSAWVEFSGEELGEGFGTLEVTVTAIDGAYTTQKVTDLLVDLSPPTAYFDATVLPASGAKLQFFIADAWVVSGFSLVAGDSTVSGQLEPGYPSTLGVEWDYSLVSIPVEQLPVGMQIGQLTVWDAAGNYADMSVPFTIDGTPPTSAMVLPSDGVTVSGLFSVTFAGQDDLPGPVSLELRVGGSLVATGLGPSTTVTLDAGDLPKGQIVISTRAVDQAGNVSAADAVTVTVAH